MLTEGGRRPTEVSILARLRAPSVSPAGISNPAPPSEFGWNGTNNASSESANLRKNKTADDCKTVPDRSDDSVPPSRYATASSVGLVYA